ncbi:DsbC family protein [Geotalea sp. SG265]|uniref:DsbC family protein n=1 Tax=Geotalea sp. SG265 TaxID=2922867 RepID=UPI001FAED368|nr:DsbC family protein [Geotalea sp. SG265]
MIISRICAGFSLALVCTSAAFAATAAVKPEVAFKQAFPQVKVDGFEATDISGIYQVVTGQNVLYYAPEKDYVILGEIFTKEGKSLTAEKKGQLAAKLVQSLPLDKAVKIGEGKNVIIEFTDPDCPFCRKAAEYLMKKTDVTRYVFFAPLAHPAAITKIQYILNAENKVKAYDAMMLGQEIPANAPPVSDKVKALAQEHLDLARKVGVQGTPTFFVNGQQVVGADTNKIEQLLKK